MKQRRRPARLMWGPHQAVRQLSLVQLLITDILLSRPLPTHPRRLQEHHLHHADFHPLPFVAVLTTARIMLFELTGPITTEAPPQQRLCWEMQVRPDDATTPSG